MKKLIFFFFIIHALHAQDWVSQSAITSNTFKSVYFINEQTGWAACSNKIFKTVNGGNNWVSTDISNSIGYANDIFFLDASKGWAAGYNGGLAKTINGGQSWQANYIGTISKDFNSIYFTSFNNYGWVVGDSGIIYRTKNGGYTWTSQYSGTLKHLKSVFFIDTLKGWAVGTDTTIIYTSNGGQTWKKQIIANNIQDDINSVFFIDSLTGWCVGGRLGGTSFILKTS